ncbi:hypothetical protein PQX77_016929 [Marasmius sp. AFHP31]|nr:hypothetical protein PQX77_016929 [Marasmius sp. AFHP31]
MYYLSLNRAALIFVPPQEALGIQEPVVVQVIVSFAEAQNPFDTHTVLSSIDMLTYFYDIQVEVTQAVRNLVVYDLVTPLDLEDRNVDIDGQGYVLRGTKKKWRIAEQLDGALRWGTGIDSKVLMATHKWIFELEMLEDRISSQMPEEQAEMDQVERMLAC